MVRSASIFRTAATLGCIAAFLAPVEARGEAGLSAEERLRACVTAAWRGPVMESALAALERERAALLREAHPGGPYTEMQREGLTSGLDDADNATWYLRLGAPFHLPWQRTAVRAALDANERHIAALRLVVALDVARFTGEAWLELAAVEARLQVRRAQSARLDEALSLQRKRFELGEVAGAEVTQLEFERLRLGGEIAALGDARAEARSALERSAGRDVALPDAHDLSPLHAALRPWTSPGTGIEAWLASSPVLRSAALRTERVSREGRQDRRTAFGPSEAEIEWERVPAVDELDGFDAVGLRLRVPLPVGGLARRQAAEASARNREAQADEERLRREFASRLTADLARAELAAARLEDLRDFESGLAEVEWSISSRYRLGAISYLEFIDGLSRLDEVRIQAIDARLAALRTRLGLAVLTGDLTLFPIPDPAEEANP